MSTYQLLVTQILFNCDGVKTPVSNSTSTLTFHKMDEAELAMVQIDNDKDINSDQMLTYATRLY